MIEWTLHDWLRSTEAKRSRWLDSLSGNLPAGFELPSRPAKTPSPGSFALPELRHDKTGTEWILIPGHSYTMGMSRDEELSARAIEDPPPLNLEEMRPVHSVEVAPFLIMKRPLAGSVVRKHIELEKAGPRPEFAGPDASRPMYLLRTEIERLQGALGFMLPTEEQWEAACRGGTQTLFFFGDELPDGKELERLVTPELDRALANPFGLLGLFVGEWCRDRWRPSYGKAKPTKHFAARGGASAFWPWQGSEWSFCVSSMRMPSSDLLNGLSGARFVVELR